MAPCLRRFSETRAVPSSGGRSSHHEIPAYLTLALRAVVHCSAQIRSFFDRCAAPGAGAADGLAVQHAHVASGMVIQIVLVVSVGCILLTHRLILNVARTVFVRRTCDCWHDEALDQLEDRRMSVSLGCRDDDQLAIWDHKDGLPIPSERRVGL